MVEIEDPHLLHHLTKHSGHRPVEKKNNYDIDNTDTLILVCISLAVC